MITDSAIPEEAMTDLASVARILAYRVRQDADRIGEDVRNPRLTMEHHARDLDSLAARLDKVAAALPHLRVQKTPSVDRQTLALLLEDTVGTLDKGEEWYIADRILALTRLPTPHPRPVVDREAVIQALAGEVRGWPVDAGLPHHPDDARVVQTFARLADAVLALLPTESAPWEGITSREPEGEVLTQMRKWYAAQDLPGPPCICPTDADVTVDMRNETGQHLTGCPLSSLPTEEGEGS